MIVRNKETGAIINAYSLTEDNAAKLPEILNVEESVKLILSQLKTGGIRISSPQFENKVFLGDYVVKHPKYFTIYRSIDALLRDYEILASERHEVKTEASETYEVEDWRLTENRKQPMDLWEIARTVMDIYDMSDCEIKVSGGSLHILKTNPSSK
jgi:hypothetical protein